MIFDLGPGEGEGAGRGDCGEGGGYIRRIVSNWFLTPVSFIS